MILSPYSLSTINKISPTISPQDRNPIIDNEILDFTEIIFDILALIYKKQIV